MATAVIDSALERLIRRAAPLTFGMFATVGGPDEMQSRGGGSGIFIAPFLALCARHVSLDLFRLEGRDERPRRGTILTQHSVALFQVLDPFDQESKKSLWHVDRSWNSRYSDMTMLQTSAEDDESDKMQYQWPTQFFDLQLLPPERGSKVTAIGYPQMSADTATGLQLEVDARAKLNKRAIIALGYLSRALAAKRASVPLVHNVRDYILSLRTNPKREFLAGAMASGPGSGQ
jgi:hypothetical protein